MNFNRKTSRVCAKRLTSKYRLFYSIVWQARIQAAILLECSRGGLRGLGRRALHGWEVQAEKFDTVEFWIVLIGMASECSSLRHNLVCNWLNQATTRIKYRQFNCSLKMVETSRNRKYLEKYWVSNLIIINICKWDNKIRDAWNLN